MTMMRRLFLVLSAGGMLFGLSSCESMLEYLLGGSSSQQKAPEYPTLPPLPDEQV